MRRDFSSGSMTSSYFLEDQDSDPRNGLVNLSDAMLVFACGLMLALVAAWHLDVNQLSEVTVTDQVVEIDDADTTEVSGVGEGFVDMGRVYQDPETGKLYILDDSAEQAEEAGAQVTSNSTG